MGTRKPALLAIAPYYPAQAPPAGAAAVLGYLAVQGCHEFDFVDFRLWFRNLNHLTYRPEGAFGETFVMDVPDLPLVLKLLRAFRTGRHLIDERDEVFDDYCLARRISPQALFQHLVELDRFFARAAERLEGVKFLGFSTWTTNYLQTLLAAAHFKRCNPDTFIVAGGPQVSESLNSAKLGLKAGVFDAVIRGEGEQALLELYRAVAESGYQPPTGSIPGVLRYRRDSDDFEEPDRELLRIASLPPPRFDEMHVAAYQKDPSATLLPYQLSRGCTDKCSFCSEWVLWERFRLSRPESSVEQIKELVSRYGMNRAMFTDSLLNGTVRRLRAFAEGMLEESIDLIWGGFMRAQVDAETAELLARSGCRFVFLGIESLSDETLELMNKRRTGADNIEALEHFLRQGMRVAAGFFPGFPGDTRERFLRTARILAGLKDKYRGRLRLNMEQFVVSPGQPIFKELRKYGLEPHGWDERTLGIEPGLRDITDGIICRVTGANQGIERLGQYAVVSVLAHESRQELESGFDPFIYELSGIESVSERRLDLSASRGGWWVGRFRTAYGSLVALLLTSEERTLYSRLLDVERGRTRNGGRLLDDSRVAAFLAEIAARHLVAPALESPTVVPTHSGAALGEEHLLRPSPFVAARVMDADEPDGLWLLDAVTLRSLRTHPAAAQLLSELEREPRSMRQLVAWAVDGDLPFEAEAVRHLLSEWSRAGFLIGEPGRDPAALQLAGFGGPRKVALPIVAG